MENQGQDTNREPTTDYQQPTVGKGEQTPNPEPAKSKGLIWVLVAVIVILLGAVGYLLLTKDQQQTIDNGNQEALAGDEAEESPQFEVPEGWQIYNDPAADFSFYFPAEWRIVIMSDGAVRLVSWDENSVSETDDLGKNKAVLDFIPLNENVRNIPDAEQFERSLKEGYGSNVHSKLISVRDFNIDGNLAREFVFEQVSKSTAVYVKKGDRIFLLSLSVGISSDQSVVNSYKLEFDQIISTFKFKGLINTSRWKTYRNEEYGFSFQYPENAVFTESTNSYGTQIISFEVPFVQKYGKFNYKNFSVQIYPSSCPNVRTLSEEKITINGTSYNFENPPYGATSGMSSINRFKQYLLDRNDKCFVFEERIAGTGTNETPPGTSQPDNFDAYFDSEMKILDEIMQTVKF